MREFALQAALAAALAAGPLVATPCLAGSPYYEPSGVGAGGTFDARAVPGRRIGHFTCSYNERRTRLERKNCGGARY